MYKEKLKFRIFIPQRQMAQIKSRDQVSFVLIMFAKQPHALPILLNLFFFLKFPYFFSNLYTQCEARTHNPEIKSHMLFRLSQADAPSLPNLLKPNIYK